MSIETRIDKRLWDVIRSSIESRNYSAAVLDAIHFLSDAIRDRSGVEGDGVALIGAAFGAKSPKLKVNRLQTESEQNVQRGVESLLRGLYQAIRNPRSHGSAQDSEQDATAILLFTDYLLRIVEGSRAPFSLQHFVGRIVDPDFVPNERYAKLLVDEVPKNKRLAASCEVFTRRSELDGDKARYFFDEIFQAMETSEIDEFFELVSDQLRDTDDDADIRFVLTAFKAERWIKISEVARLRVENKLIRSTREGRLLESNDRCPSGSLGTWTTRIVRQFTLKNELWSAVWNKLESENEEQRAYAEKYFLWHVPSCFDAPPRRLKKIVIAGLNRGDVRFKRVAEMWGYDVFEERSETDPWRSPFVEALSTFVEANGDALSELSADDIPF